MALIEHTALEINGKIGDKVYYEKDGVLVYRRYFKPVQPGTPAQLAWWKVFRDGVTSWQGLSESEKQSWNKKSIPHKMSGFNLYMRKWLLS